MSFITKRDHIFDDFAVYNMPARNEGKLKAYSSCTDARAWSHFCSDKSEHLVEIIKRNNEIGKPKFIPTNVIIETLMSSKNAEIARLKRKIEQYDQMIASYDELDLTCQQKCEIARAHAALKDANKELNELYLDLDMSACTEGSDPFETGKSRGDEPCKNYGYAKPTKGNQTDQPCPCEVSTMANDPRIDEMQEAIINKDAKLSAMQNTIAVLENDVCEPYCIYAHIYTALEKIFAILCQNRKYKLYLELMTSGREKKAKNMDIKGKILLKLKILEKFTVALVAPCSQERPSEQHETDCYRAEISTRIETTFALTSAEYVKPSVDKKRAELVADIMENEEMREILCKDCLIENDLDVNDYVVEDYNIETENLKRLKQLQENYDDLMSFYESLKNEKQCLIIRCRKYEELEKDFESLKCQLREYNALWNEKEHYRKRSIDLDELKEQFLVLSNETCSLETQLKAETEINNIKTKSIDELRKENLVLENKLNDALIAFEKEKNYLQCKIKECECKEMCQDQQIKSLTVQIDRLLEQDSEHAITTKKDDLILLNEINEQKEQIQNLKDLLYGSEEEKQQLQDEYQNKLNVINGLRMEIEDWKSTYEKAIQRTEYLTDDYNNEIQKLMNTNASLTREIADKESSIEKIIDVLNKKSQEVNQLMESLEQKNVEICTLRDIYQRTLSSLDDQKLEAMNSLEVAKKESQELLRKYADKSQKEEELAHNLQVKSEEFKKLKEFFECTQMENKNLQNELQVCGTNNAFLREEIERLKMLNIDANKNVNNLENENENYKLSLQLTRRESQIMLEEKLQQFEDLSHQLNKLRYSHENLIEEKCRLENELKKKNYALSNATQSIELSKSQSNELVTRLRESESKQSEFTELTNVYERSVRANEALEKELSNKVDELNNVYQSFEELKNHHDIKCQEIENLSKELTSLQAMFQNMLMDKNLLQSQNNNKTEELNNLYSSLEEKVEENKDLHQQIQILETNRNALIDEIELLKSNHANTLKDLAAAQNNNEDHLEKNRFLETLVSEYDRLKTAYDNSVGEKNRLKQELEMQMTDLRKLQRENNDLQSQGQNLESHSKVLEDALVNARTELIAKSSDVDNYPRSTIIKEIQEMKREKLDSHNKIRELLEQLEQSEQMISNLSEDVLARDKKIAVLENYVNNINDEMSHVHDSFRLAVDVSEEITVNSNRKIQESMKTLDAHHSKTTHDMRIEIAKLRNENMKLEEQLSTNKIKSEEFDQNKDKYQSQIIELQNEREIVVKNIKEIELNSVGDSALAPNKCDVGDILSSLDRIRNFLDSRCSQNLSLERALKKVQDLVQTKADEAKKMVEKEKEKTTSEKEEAIRDKNKMEKQLEDLKQKLDRQRTQDKEIIKDLESEIQNQKLIIDKINKSTDVYITKLKEEMHLLQTLYQNSLDQIKDVEAKFKSIKDEHNITIKTIEDVNEQLEDKCKEIEMLRKLLNELKKPLCHEASTQVYPININQNTGIQTDKLREYEHFIRYEKDTTESNKFVRNGISTDKPVNEIQVLTANVDSNFDHGKPEFSHKVQQGNILQSEDKSSGPSHRGNQHFHKDDQPNQQRSFNKHVNTSTTTATKADPKNFIDIYNKKSMHTNSFEIEKDNLENQIGHNNTEDGFRTRYENNDSDNNIENQSINSTDQDLFVIYRDSDSVNGNKPEKNMWSNGRSEILVESVRVRPQTKKQGQLNRPQDMSDSIIDKESEELEEDDSVKQKLHINVPRVDVETQSVEIIKALESYTLYSTTNEYTLPKLNTVETDNINMKKKKQSVIRNDFNAYMKSLDYNNENQSRTQNPNETSNRMNKISSNRGKSRNVPDNATLSPESHYALSRVEADLLLIKNEEQSPKQQYDSFALNYIIDSFLVEGQDEKSYNAAKALRKARSDDNLNNTVKINGRTDSSPSRLSDLKPSENKTYVTGDSPSKTSETSELKSYVEQSIMAKLDNVEDYETKIRHLSKTLENIEKDYKKKIEVIKTQYDNNIKSIINEHNQGVHSIQSLHEETLHDIIKMHENEVENWRSMSIEAMRKADILEKENKNLKCKIEESCSSGIDEVEEPVKITTPDFKKRRTSRIDSVMLTKTNVEAFNVKPKLRTHGPCTCSLDVNVSDTIRHIFEQVDVDQRKLAEQTYLRYIANKILNSNVEGLDTQELSFLHFKVCRIWKMKLTKEELLQKRIDSLEAELLHKQKNTQQNIAELDRKVAEERRRLQEVREAVCKHSTSISRNEPEHEVRHTVAAPTSLAQNKEFKHSCLCNSPNCKLEICERRSTGDLTPATATIRPKRTRVENNRAVSARLDMDVRRERKIFTDETPTRLRKPYDRQSRLNKK